MTKGMIAYSGEVYLPFLAANAAAVESREETFSVELEGKLYSQVVFKYQVKCLDELKTRYLSLPKEAKDIVDGLIGEAGIKILS